MKRNETTKAFMMISNCKKRRSPWFIQKYFSILRVNWIAATNLINLSISSLTQLSPTIVFLNIFHQQVESQFIIGNEMCA